MKPSFESLIQQLPKELHEINYKLLVRSKQYAACFLEEWKESYPISFQLVTHYYQEYRAWLKLQS